MKALLPEQIGLLTWIEPNTYVRGSVFHRGQNPGQCWKVLDWYPASPTGPAPAGGPSPFPDHWGHVNLKVWFMPACKDKCVES